MYGFVRFGTTSYQYESIKLSLKQSIYQHSSYGTNVNYHTKVLKNLKSEPCPEMVKIGFEKIRLEKIRLEKIRLEKIRSKNFGSNFTSGYVQILKFGGPYK